MSNHDSSIPWGDKSKKVWCLRCDEGEIDSNWRGLDNSWTTHCPECGFYVSIDHKGETIYTAMKGEFPKLAVVPSGCLFIMPGSSEEL